MPAPMFARERYYRLLLNIMILIIEDLDEAPIIG